MSSSVSQNQQKTLEELLDLINDPGSGFYTLAEMHKEEDGTVVVHTNAPIAHKLEDELGDPFCTAEGDHTLVIPEEPDFLRDL